MDATFSKDDMRRIALLERERLRQTLSALTEEQWEAPSLCSGWTVRHVAGHVAQNVQSSMAGFLVGMARVGFNHDQYNIQTAARWAQLPRTRILRALEGDRMMFFFRLNPFLMAVDTLVHHQDIRRPLGLGTDAPAEHLLAALRAVTTESMFASDAKRASGLRLVATDLQWTYGDGPVEVRGRAEALLMALMGRSVGTDELTGLDAQTGRNGQPGRVSLGGIEKPT